MTDFVDFFFSPYLTAQQRRLRAAIEDGLAHGSRIDPLDPLPDQAVALLFSSNVLTPIEHVAVYYTTDGTEPSGEKGYVLNGRVVEATKGDIVQDVVQQISIQQWHVRLPAQLDNTLVRYRADGWSVSDPLHHWYADNADPVSLPPVHGRIFAYHVDRWTTPQWWHDAVVYQVFVDRFSAAHDEPSLLDHDQADITSYFGGTLRGVLEKLDYIQALGVNCLWLSPIFESPTYHGYNPSDYHNVARRYGTNENLLQLIQAAHQRGMRVMLDFVANHTSDEHPLFVAARNGSDRTAANWYAFGGESPHGYRSYARVQDMPELMTDNPDVQRYLSDAALYWLGHFGADALRLDYVSGPSHAFWTLFQCDVKAHFPQAMTIGEITAPIEEIANYAGRIDGFMDFPLAKMLRKVFALRTAPIAELLTYLDTRQDRLPLDMSRATLLDNHDMHRFLWIAEGQLERLQLAAACQLTLAGTPIIYYGTEVGLSQYADAYQENSYARPPMLWDQRQNQTLLAYYRHLVALRHTYPALRYGASITLPTELIDVFNADKNQLGAYLRYMHGQYLLVVLNNHMHEVSVRLALNATLALAQLTGTPPGTLQNLLADTANASIAVVDGSIELTLPSLSAAIFVEARPSDT